MGRESIIVRRYESLSEYVALCPPTYENDSREHHWDNGVSTAEAIKRGLQGDASLVAQATAAVDKVGADALKLVPRQANVAALVGSRVNVPAYLGNEARCMVKRTKVQRDTRHVTIYVNACSSGGIEANELVRRGCTILGLLEVLQACQVGVDLYVTCDVDGMYYTPNGESHFQCVRLESRPLDLSQVSFVLAHPAFARHVMYGVGAKTDGNGNYNGGPNRSLELAKKAYNLQPGDVYVPAAYLRDTIDAAWLERQLKTILGTADDGDVRFGTGSVDHV